jgi:hypothetical protein
MALAIATVADSISKLSISGLTIKDVNELPDSVQARDCPVIIPAPNFVTNFQAERQELTVNELDYRYTLNYRLLAFPVGSGRGIFEAYPKAVEWTGKFLDALVANHSITGAVDIEPGSVISFGVVEDPGGSSFHGCDIAINVLEFK